jgi:hypothetical protein
MNELSTQLRQLQIRCQLKNTPVRVFSLFPRGFLVEEPVQTGYIADRIDRIEG